MQVHDPFAQRCHLLPLGFDNEEGVRFFRNDTINSSFPVPPIALFGQPFFPPGTSFKGTRTEGISANVAW